MLPMVTPCRHYLVQPREQFVEIAIHLFNLLAARQAGDFLQKRLPLVNRATVAQGDPANISNGRGFGLVALDDTGPFAEFLQLRGTEFLAAKNFQVFRRRTGLAPVQC